MATRIGQAPAAFDPAAFETFRFLSREIDASGRVTLTYGLDDAFTFVEEIELPLASPLGLGEQERLQGLLSLLHWVAGVSYFKTAAPPLVSCESGLPSPAVADLLEALYSEGLGEFAYTNALPALPRPRFPRRAASPLSAPSPTARSAPPRRVLVPVGGGKDSVVAIEVVRRAAQELALFSLGDAAPIARTTTVAELPWLMARRRLDPRIGELNRGGALNGHVPVTAIVACVALLTAALHGFDSVAMANERSASSGNLHWDGIEVNHQFSKGLAVERLLREALAEIGGTPRIFSVLRPASELAIARAFARLEPYHAAFTSCNASFRLDPSLRSSSWCCECPKCRFVFLALAPFTAPARLAEIFGRDLLAEEDQFEGFALLSASGGHKPFECVGEEEESLAAIRLLARDPRWASHAVVRRLAVEVLAAHPASAGDPDAVLALGSDHFVPAALLPHVRALLAA